MAEILFTNQERELDRFFEELIDDLYLKYHCHATDQPSLPLTEEFNGEISFYDGLARGFNFIEIQGLSG